MSPIPLTSFRILDHKRNWQKSFNEIVDDDELDYKEFLDNLLNSRNRFFNPEKEEFGPWEGAPKDITLLWLNYFVLVMRCNVKTAYISTGQENRGIPADVAEGYRAHNSKRVESFKSTMLSASAHHFYFLHNHLFAARESRSKSQFLDFLFEETYVSLIDSAHTLLKRNPFFGDQTLDLPALIRDLRVRWIQEYKQVEA